jgi:hypothetical protein
VPWVAMIHADATTFLLSLHPVFFFFCERMVDEDGLNLGCLAG